MKTRLEEQCKEYGGHAAPPQSLILSKKVHSQPGQETQRQSVHPALYLTTRTAHTGLG